MPDREDAARPSRTWVAFGHHRVGPDGVHYFGNLHMSERTARCYSTEVVQVALTEDPEGRYYAWIDADKDSPTMIQPRRSMFDVQFPYGPNAEAARGQGEVVRLRAEPAPKGSQR